LLAASADGAPGTLPASQSGVNISRPGVLVTAFGANPDGPGTILRVWEQAGKSGETTVTLPVKFTEALPVTLRGERTGAPIGIHANKLVFPLKCNAPASFILR
jgi:hypothetical protein